MALLGRADEVVVRKAERLRHLDEARGVAIGQRARRDPFPLRRLLHLEAVLVGAGQEEDVLAVEPLETRDHVGGDGLVSVADMRHAVRVGDGRRNVEFVPHAKGFLVDGRWARHASGSTAARGLETRETSENERFAVKVQGCGIGLVARRCFP